MPQRRADIRRQVVVLVLLVLAVDAVAIALFYLLGLDEASTGVKLGFTALWTVATLAVVLTGLTRIRQARVRRHPPPDDRP